ncbi:acetyl-CoA synthetase-like protein [Aspergillus taichungensis]|uniref:Acetyl-CoA synthetase-like protein n=1 Tax=Aspergillus taichungensis TaxID=482145 RepID=A0A2J5HMJ5_9EURO|nr:acetyl-CoA synthetase-like protein [Aspergillus taichungensis]
MSSPQPHIDIPETDLWSFLFERIDRGYPTDRVLFTDVDTGESLTYGETRQNALDFAHQLQQRWGWKKGDVLIVFSANSLWLPPVIWGTLAAGGVVNPVNPDLTADELLTRMKLGTTVATQKDRLPVALEAVSRAGIPSSRVIVIDDLPMQLENSNSNDRSIHGPHTPPICDPARDLAFLAYSSGTSGMPKPVMLSHRNMVANLCQLASRRSAGVGGYSGRGDIEDRDLAILPLFHIFGLTVILNLNLYMGVPTFIMPQFRLDSFCAAVQRHQITHAGVVPSVIQALVSHPHVTSAYNLSSLQFLSSAAAPLGADLVHALYAKLRLRVGQGYGLTECSPATHTQTWKESPLYPGCVGRLLPNMTARFVPVEGEDQSNGSCREIWLKGPNVFLGYLGDEQKTRDHFSADGFFKTGDVGFEDEHGNLVITGRIKELIKYNGCQVAPAELESIALRHCAVADVAVTGVQWVTPDRMETEAPAAFVVVRSGHLADECTSDTIREFVDEQVESHKQLRGGVHFVSEIPRNAAGKILRRKLQC